MNEKKEINSLVEIHISGEKIKAREGETIASALWEAGMGKSIQIGCGGGVCGACVVSLRFKDGRAGGTDLACMRLVEEGMEIFPFPIDAIPPVEPVNDPTSDKLRQAFPTLDRCTKCGSCTTACPMSIPVMDSVLRMQKDELQEVAEDFNTCIHCGLCRVVCEDRVKPHNMGIWVRRSLGKSQEFDQLEKIIGSSNDDANKDWEYLLEGNSEERLQRAKLFREGGKRP
jgi:succinate dehydrogenase/fumarate reductase-like Fe-S protein